jgi:hypothetical protein
MYEVKMRVCVVFLSFQKVRIRADSLCDDGWVVDVFGSGDVVRVLMQGVAMK